MPKEKDILFQLVIHFAFELINILYFLNLIWLKLNFLN